MSSPVRKVPWKGPDRYDLAPPVGKKRFFQKKPFPAVEKNNLWSIVNQFYNAERCLSGRKERFAKPS